MEQEGARIESWSDRKGRLPRKQITDRTEFRKIAKLLAKRVKLRRILYGEAETALMKLRVGSHYQRLEKAEGETARALSAAFNRMDSHLPLTSPPSRPSSSDDKDIAERKAICG